MKSASLAPLFAGLLAAVAAVSAFDASAGLQDRQLALRGLVLPADTTTETVASSLPKAQVVGSRVLTGSEADIAQEVMPVDGYDYSVSLAPGSDDAHRLLTVVARQRDVDVDNHLIRKTITLKPRDIAVGKTIILFVPGVLSSGLEVCTGHVGECPNTAALFSTR